MLSFEYIAGAALLSAYAWGFGRLVWSFRNIRKPAPVAPVERGPAGHCRCYIGTFDFRISYYGPDGRKRTTRNAASFADLLRLRKLARAKGYYVI